MNKRRGQVGGRGVVQECGLILIILNRPDLANCLEKVGYLCRSGHQGHSLWDAFSTARAYERGLKGGNGSRLNAGKCPPSQTGSATKSAVAHPRCNPGNAVPHCS